MFADITKKDMDPYSILSRPDSISTMFKNQVVPDDQIMTLSASSPPVTFEIQSSFSDYFSENYNRIDVPLSWQRIISGGVLLAVGLVLSLFGFLHLRFSLLLTGFVGGGAKHGNIFFQRWYVIQKDGSTKHLRSPLGIAAFAILTNTEPSTLWSDRILIYVSVCIAAGLLIGMVMLALNKYASWILGGAGGKNLTITRHI